MAESIHLAVQHHLAERAGEHWDIRVVLGDKAFSFATRKWPDLLEGKKVIGFEQPVHTAHYALQKKVVIPSGQYGAGVTTLDYVQRGKAEIGHDYYRLELNNGDKFTLKKMPQFGEDAYMIQNLTKSKNWKPLDHEKEKHPELIAKKMKAASKELAAALKAGKVD